MDDLRTELSIDGSWRAAADGARFAVHDPATGAELATVADATVADALAAVAAAHARAARLGGGARRASAATCCAAPSS